MNLPDSQVISQFLFSGTHIGTEPLLAGHINRTYVLTYRLDGGGQRRYLLQRVNTDIFRSPVKLIENIDGVTRHIRRRMTQEGCKNVESGTLTLIGTKAGALYYIDQEGGFWRAYDYIENSIAYQRAERPILFYNAGVALGRFQKYLSDYPAETLYDTIPNFHNTPVRFRDFAEAVKADRAGRADSVREEIAFVLSREAICGRILSKMEAGLIPVRVTHNDTKLNNVLLDDKTDEVLCFVDLDTVMPGSALYDFGDSIRFGASSADEDEQDLRNVYMDIDLFRTYTEGYLSQVARVLTEAELEELAFSAILLTYECGMRFLMDHMNGDTYFQIHRPGHNLDRARTQFKLVADMEGKLGEMQQIVKDCAARLR